MNFVESFVQEITNNFGDKDSDKNGKNIGQISSCLKKIHATFLKHLKESSTYFVFKPTII